MPGLNEPETIDLVAADADGTPLLVAVEVEPWGTYPDEIDRLVTKLNTYATYKMRQLADDAADLAGRPAIVQLRCPVEPTPEIADVLDVARGQLEPHDIRIDVLVRPDLMSEKPRRRGWFRRR